MALKNLAAGDGDDAAARRAALVQAGAPAALVVAAREAGRAGNESALRCARLALERLGVNAPQ